MQVTEEQAIKLAKDVVDYWDMDTLVDYAYIKLKEDYLHNPRLFENDVKLMCENKEGA